MSSFNPLSFAQIVQNEIAAVEAASGPLMNFNSGSVLLSILQANAGNSLWLQGLTAYLLSITRLATSTGINVDTFVQDFGYARAPAIPATGNVTFSRLTATIAAVIPADNQLVGGSITPATISSSTTQVVYFVTVDPDNIYWVPDQFSYVVPINVSSITVPVQAVAGGEITNALPGQIDTIDSVVVGMDNVTNADQFINGADPATDDQVREGFVLYLASLFRATEQALAYAISIVPDVTRYSLVENLTHPSGDPSPGFFYAVIDDGTGDPSDNLVTEVYNSLANYRGLCINYAVYKPIVIDVTIVVSVKTTGVNSSATVIANIKNDFVNYINNLSFNISLYYTRVAQVCYGADPTIIDVFDYTLNGATADLPGDVNTIFLINPSDITVTVNP